MRQDLKDASGRLIGWTEKIGNLLYIKNRGGKSLGTYDPRTNRTLEMSGNLIGYGNWLASLLDRN